MADVVYFVRDMLFTSKIREVAKQRGLEAKSAADPASFAAAARDAKVAIVDLRLELALPALAALAAALPAGAATPRTIGFVDHELTDVMSTARAHGCTTVLAKGQFSKELPALLANLG